MSDGMMVDNLCELAVVLADGAQGFENLAVDAPAIPDAGASSGVVAELLVALSEAMSTAALSAANAADLVQANAAEFDATEGANAARVAGAKGVPR
ncbi:hypothetical protein FK531_20370 [Rhodococcus spelaei]|uniref:Uncharacterized protein n=1 Tax=Rhodococcus spelaei TaxID=2546320 RepID=A0A541B0E0_9NOCA|nr:hypothetical protein [Rhodococcus spelaei]TQF65787.1 hypothetical protein FK531_20370 [Rhodococcus spelaei]